LIRDLRAALARREQGRALRNWRLCAQWKAAPYTISGLRYIPSWLCGGRLLRTGAAAAPDGGAGGNLKQRLDVPQA